MSEIIKRLQERRANIWEQAKALLDAAEAEKRDLSAEEEASYQALNADLDKIDARAQEFRDAEQRAKDADEAFAELLGKPATGQKGTEDRSAELRKWLTGESGKRAFEIHPDANTPQEFRLLKSGTGGNTVPISFYHRLVEHMIEVSGVLMTNPTLLRTTSGEQIQVPKTTAHVVPSGAPNAPIAEGAQITAVDPTLGQVPLDAYKYPVLLKVSNELLTDTAVDLEGYIARSAGRAIGNWFGTHLVTGSGSGQPNGVATAATVGVTAAAGTAGAITADGLIDLFYSVIAPYRNSPSCGWLMRDTTVASVRKLKDTTNQYIWQPGLAGTPDTILGKTLYTDPNVAAPAALARSVLFGDFSAYFVRQVAGIRFERSDDFLFDTDMVAYRAIVRADGDLVDTTGAIKCWVGAGT
ncbi:phage major capsid protein [Sphaerisporangium sp. NPDC051011]|uniref:phage major capsid protein n=1 Tax=Sphaerisporangium sp. NPDC051011 TaxID=3155792 RepID=UPI0033C68341